MSAARIPADDWLYRRFATEPMSAFRCSSTSFPYVTLHSRVSVTMNGGFLDSAARIPVEGRPSASPMYTDDRVEQSDTPEVTVTSQSVTNAG